MSRGWFVTGTDTGVGKTTVTQALLAAASDRGFQTAGYKPIESGCLQPNSCSEAMDATALNQAATLSCQVTYAFADPIAPAVAAAKESTSISTTLIAKQAQTIATQVDILLVEGAGGLLVPTSSTETIADVALALAYPLIIVAADKLGVMNHALLTVEAARQRGLHVAAIVLNCVEPSELPELENESQIAQHTQAPVYRFPYGGADGAARALLDELLTDAKTREQLI